MGNRRTDLEPARLHPRTVRGGETLTPSLVRRRLANSFAEVRVLDRSGAMTIREMARKD